MLIIVNPSAGHFFAEKCGKMIEEELLRRGTPHTIVYTERPGHATELAAAGYADGERVFVVVGGDGTLHEAVNGFGGCDVSLGIIPAGSGNDLIRSLGIPDDPMKALEIVLEGKSIRMDLPRCNDFHFLNYCGLGFDVDTIARSEKLKGHVPKSSIYLLALLMTLFCFRFKRVTLKSDVLSFTKDILMINVANGRFYGGGIPFSPESSAGDRILDVCIISRIPRILVPYMLIYFLMGKHARFRKYVQFIHVPSLTIDSAAPETIGTDGDLLAATPARFDIGDQINVFSPLEVM